MKFLARAITVTFLLSILLMPHEAQAFGWLKNIRMGSFSDEYVDNFYQAKTTLNNFIDEYESKNLMRVMDCVSERYTTDKTILEDSLREEFSQFASIEMRYYVDKVLFDDKNENVLITITYVKRVQNRSTANLSVSQGASDLIFKKEDGKYLLWKMTPKFIGKN